MSINNIQLKDLVVSQLYKDLLLATEHTPAEHVATAPTPTEQVAAKHTPAATAAVPPAPKPSPAPSGYKTLGNNLRNITIVVHSPGIAFLPDDQLGVLTRMLEACRMNIGDVAIVNHAASPVVIGPLKQQLKPSFVLLFGPAPQTIGLPMDFPVFKIQEYDQCTYLTAPSLEELVRPGDESRLLKSKLWVCLKTLFGI
ncbi:MAG TPA: hypothetical protein VHC48_15350 [Puia sp.]|nr:hypothetical protein [Puia sp.]